MSTLRKKEEHSITLQIKEIEKKSNKTQDEQKQGNNKDYIINGEFTLHK